MRIIKFGILCLISTEREVHNNFDSFPFLVSNKLDINKTYCRYLNLLYVD